MPRPTHSARFLTLAIALAAGNTPALGGGESLLERWAAHRCAADGGGSCLLHKLEAAEAAADRSLFFDAATGRDAVNYPPHRVVDTLNMRLDILIRDMNSRRFDAVQTLTVAPIAEPLETLSLDARLLTITAVESPGRNATFTHDGRKLVVTLNPPVPVGEQASIRTTYTLRDPIEGLFWTPESPAWPGRAAQIHSQGQPETNSFWFPAHDFPNERLTTELVVTAPAGYVVSGNGRLVSRNPTQIPGPDGAAADYEVWHWAQDEQAGGGHVNYLVSLVVGKFDIVDVAGKHVEFRQSKPKPFSSSLARTSRPIPMPVYVPVGREDDVLGTYGRTAAMTRFFENRFEEPYPWARYAQLVVHNFGAGGMENTSASTMFDTAVFSKEALFDHDLDGLISHELAHQWFGDLITCNSWEHIWLNEGFATYLTALWYEQRDSRAGYDAQMFSNFDSVIGADRGKAPETPGMVSKAYGEPWDVFRRGSNPYPKGASVLHMLRRKLGDEIFFRGINTYVDRFKHKTVETDDLRIALEEVSGESLERFFTQWCERPGIPRLKAGLIVETGLVRLTLEQTQPIDAYNPAFAFRLPILIKTSAGKPVLRHLDVDARSASIDLPVEGAVDWVAIDPDLHVLAEWDLSAPSNLLAELACEGPTPASRLRAARALAANPGDIGARVLADLAADQRADPALRAEAFRGLRTLKLPGEIDRLIPRTADDPLVRLAAIESLAAAAAVEGTSDEDRLRAGSRLIDAVSDKSQRVRAAAARGLGTIKQPHHIPTLVFLCSADPANDTQHDQLRQAALEALAMLDRSEGLSPASQLARPGALNRTRGRAIQTLGALARHDQPRVTQEIIGYLRDPEARSRRAAAEALSGIASPEALSALDAFAGSWPEPGEARRVRRLADSLRAKLAPTAQDTPR